MPTTTRQPGRRADRFGYTDVVSNRNCLHRHFRYSPTCTCRILRATSSELDDFFAIFPDFYRCFGRISTDRSGTRWAKLNANSDPSPPIRSNFKRVADGIRTRDRRHHKPELYQLSYCHRARPNLPQHQPATGPRLPPAERDGLVRWPPQLRLNEPKSVKRVADELTESAMPRFESRGRQPVAPP